jgi:hypothetical protein
MSCTVGPLAVAGSCAQCIGGSVHTIAAAVRFEDLGPGNGVIK